MNISLIVEMERHWLSMRQNSHNVDRGIIVRAKKGSMVILYPFCHGSKAVVIGFSAMHEYDWRAAALLKRK